MSVELEPLKVAVEYRLKQGPDVGWERRELDEPYIVPSYAIEGDSIECRVVTSGCAGGVTEIRGVSPGRSVTLRMLDAMSGAMFFEIRIAEHPSGEASHV